MVLLKSYLQNNLTPSNVSTGNGGQPLAGFFKHPIRKVN